MSIVELISSDLRIPVPLVETVAAASNKHYAVFEIGDRLIEAPDNELKLMQTWISDCVRCETPPLPGYVTAYESGSSIVANANVHRNMSHLLNLDIHGFFRSCTYDLVYGFFSDLGSSIARSGLAVPLTVDDINTLSKLSTYRGHLSTGSPCSPSIANRIMNPLDDEIIRILPAAALYTRYSDDISISSNVWLDVDAIVDGINGVLNPAGFELNERKTHCQGRGDARRVTGVYITPSGSLSIGKRRKRKINEELYKYLVNPDDDVSSSARRILGYINFCLSIDSRYVCALIEKYSNYGRARACLGGLMELLNAEAQMTL
jgi:hypothetical protein